MPTALCRIAFAVAAFYAVHPTTHAQSQATDGPTPIPAVSSASERSHPPETTKTFFLPSSYDVHESNEVLTGVRNILNAYTRVVYVPVENVVIVAGSPDQVDIATRLFTEINHARKSYRLTYTITTLESGKLIGTEHFSLTVVSGQHSVLKQGSKIPVVIASKPDSSTTQSQYVYLDIGMNFDATLFDFATGVRLLSKIEQSSVAPEQSAAGATDPVIRQSILEGTSILTPGKPLLLGSLDVPGTTRRVDIAVTMDPAS